MRLIDFPFEESAPDKRGSVTDRSRRLSGFAREDPIPAAYPPVVFDDMTPDRFERMWCMPGHSWVRVDGGGGPARIGIDALYWRLLGGFVSAIELPVPGAVIRQGEPCAVISACHPGSITMVAVVSRMIAGPSHRSPGCMRSRRKIGVWCGSPSKYTCAHRTGA